MSRGSPFLLTPLSVFVVCCVCLIGSVCSAAADPSAAGAVLPTPDAAALDVEVTGLTLGFNGTYKLGYWTPIEVGISSAQPLRDAEVRVIFLDGDGTPTRFALPVRKGRAGGATPSDASEESSARQDWIAYGNVKVGRPDGEILVAVYRAGNIIAQRRFPIGGSDARAAQNSDLPLVLAIGQLPAVDRSLREYAQSKSLSLAVGTVSDVGQLPQQWFGYEGANAVVINASSKAAEELAAHPLQLTALRHWVQSGGRLILAAASGSTSVPNSLAADGALNPFLPGRIDRMVPMIDTIAFEDFSKTADPLGASLTDKAAIWNFPHLAGVRGQVALRVGEDAGNAPLVVHSPFGLGEVTFVAADLESIAFDSWNGTPMFLAQLLPAAFAAVDTHDSNSFTAQSSFGDLTGQLRAALDDFESDGVQTIPFWLIGVLAMVYLALIAPGDYWLLRRLRGHMEWTWLTFPLIVLAGCVVAWAVARDAKGDALKINRVEIIDVDVPNNALWGTSWLTVFSPATEQYTLGLEVTVPGNGAVPGDGAVDNKAAATGASVPTNTVLSWQGLPGSALGGMRSPATSSLFEQPYDFSPQYDELNQVPISIWSTKTFRARYSRPIENPIDLDVQLDPGAVEPELIGSVTNRLNVPLEQCVLLYRRSVYKMGKLEPGVATPLPEQWAAESVRYYLTKNQQYDSQSKDPIAILQAIMFHQQSGGRSYTHLANQFEAYLDLTHQLAADRPILVGRSTKPVAAPMLTSGAEESGGAGEATGDTIYRFVFDEIDGDTPHATDVEESNK